MARPAASAAQQPAEPRRFFTLGERGGRWWLLAPNGRPFFSLAINHIDPSPLRFTSNGDLWQRKYANSMERWHEKTGKPVLLADHAAVVKSAGGDGRHDGAGYAATLRGLRGVSGCIGSHLCGAYLRNETRRRALRDAQERPDTEAIAAITEANLAMSDWARRAGGDQTNSRS